MTVPLLALGWSTESPALLTLTESLLPMCVAWSFIICALGVPRARKIRYLLGSLCAILAFVVISELINMRGILAQAEAATWGIGPGKAALIAISRIANIAIPFVTLVLFAGKRPSALWTLEERPANQKK